MHAIDTPSPSMTNSDGGEHTIPISKMTLRQTRLDTVFVRVFRKIFHGWLFCGQMVSHNSCYTVSVLFLRVTVCVKFYRTAFEQIFACTCITKRGAKVFVNYTGFTLSCGFYGYSRNVLLWRGRLQLSIASPG